MLYYLRAVDIGDKNRRHERLVDFFYQIDRLFTLRTDDDPVGMHPIVNGAGFAQKFRIADDVELRAVTIVTLDRFGHFFTGLYRHGALIDDDAVIGQDTSNFARDFFDKAQVYAPVGMRRRGYRDENNLRVINPFLDAFGKPESVCGDIAMNQFFQTGFVDRDPAGA